MSCTAAILYEQYKKQYGYGPKHPNHLLAFAKRQKKVGLLKFCEARAIIQANDVSYTQRDEDSTKQSTKAKVQNSNSAEIAPVQSESEPSPASICTSPLLQSTVITPNGLDDDDDDDNGTNNNTNTNTNNINNTFHRFTEDQKEESFTTTIPRTLITTMKTDGILQTASTMTPIEMDWKSKQSILSEIGNPGNSNCDLMQSAPTTILRKTISNKPMPPKSPSKSIKSPNTPFSRSRSGGLTGSPICLIPIIDDHFDDHTVNITVNVTDDEDGDGDDDEDEDEDEDEVPDPATLPNAHRSLTNLPRPPKRTPSTKCNDNTEDIVFPVMKVKDDEEDSPTPPTSWDILKDSGSIAPEVIAELMKDGNGMQINEEGDGDVEEVRLREEDHGDEEENEYEDDEKSSNHQ